MKNSLRITLGLLIGFSLSFFPASVLLQQRAKPPKKTKDVTLLNRLGSGAILSLSFSPDGKWLASAGYNEGDGIGLRLWNVEERTWQFVVRRSVQAAAFSPDGRQIAYVENQRLSRMELGSGLGFEVGTLNCDIYSLSWSPDGKSIATGDSSGAVSIWDIKSRTPKKIGRSENGDIDVVAYSPSGKWVASGGDDGPATLWDPNTGSSIKTQGPAGDEVFGLAFSIDERWLVWAASNSKDAPCVWEMKAKSGFCLQSGIQKGSPYAAVFSPDGRSFLVGWSTGRVLRYSTEGKPAETVIDGKIPIYSLAISPNGKTLVTGDLKGNVRFWDIQ